MTQALRDEDSGVKAIAISFFTQGEDEHCVLNQMDTREKRKLLADLPGQPQLGTAE